MQFNLDRTRNLCQTRPPQQQIENAGSESQELIIQFCPDMALNKQY